KLYTEQLKKSADYAELNKAIGIHILNFTSIPESPKYHNVFHITEKQLGFNYFEDLELHTIELKKFSNKEEDLTAIVQKVKSNLDKWVAFLARNDLLDKNNLPSPLADNTLKKALEVLEANSLKKAKIETSTEVKKEIAKRLLNDKMDVLYVMKITDLTKEEVEELTT
ncbi:16972_t:CDS:2, partial [Racocetra persica]